ncbi:unnamed protein product [Ranitomeya imitator]|uniref:Heme NO-binding domain-containing protein n=1 Tax=Ranitomeya imitator TaxID=111125 RepID=A0ABN9MJW6_9NEOB|nr:unnamed protein product [Ranitomeya imitator]
MERRAALERDRGYARPLLCIFLQAVHFVHSVAVLDQYATERCQNTGHADLNAGDILQMFGNMFFVFCQESGYDTILRVLGSNVREFLQNLDALHDHLGTIYPGMRAPSFRCTDAEKGKGLILHYYSEREGLQDIVIGIVKTVAQQIHGTEIVMKPYSRRPAHMEPWKCRGSGLLQNVDSSEHPRSTAGHRRHTHAAPSSNRTPPHPSLRPTPTVWHFKGSSNVTWLSQSIPANIAIQHSIGAPTLLSPAMCLNSSFKSHMEYRCTQEIFYNKLYGPFSSVTL